MSRPEMRSGITKEKVPRKSSRFFRPDPLKPDQLADFCGQIGAMAGAGVPLTQAMEILQMAAEHRRFIGLYRSLQSRMEQGCPLSDAMEETELFPDLLIQMFRAAEVSGRFGETAKRMALHYRKEHKMRSQIQAATMYPKLLGVMLAAVVWFIFLVVVPMVEPMLREMSLPLLTVGIFAVSEAVIERWYLVVGAMVLLPIVWLLWCRIPTVRLLHDRVFLHTPLIGRQMRRVYTARFARSFEGLYSSGTSMVNSLEIAAATIGNRYLTRQFSGVVSRIERGESLSDAIRCVDGVDSKFAPIIRVGEESGNLDRMLHDIAEAYEYEAETSLTKLIALLEPALIVGMGVVIGVILLGIMMPMWSMYDYMA